MTTEQAHTHASVKVVRGMFGRDSIYLGLWTGQTIVAALITPAATRLLGPREFGEVYAATAVMQVMVAIASYSLQTAVQRAFAEEDGEAKARRLVLLAIWLALITFVIAFATGPLWSRALGLGDFPLPVRYAVAWAALTAISNAALGLLRSRDQLVWFALAGMMQSVVAAGLAIGLVIVGPANASSFLLGQVIGQLLCVAVALGAARPLLFSMRDAPMLWSGLRYAAALVPGALAGFIMDGSDRIIIHSDLGATAVARFAVARNIGGFVAMFLFMLGTVWMPRLYALRDSPVVGAVIRASLTGLMMVTVWLTVAIAMASPVVLWAWVPHDFEPDHLLLVTALISAMGLALAASASFTQVLLLDNASGKVSVATIVSALVNLGLNLIIVPRFGIGGAATVTLFSYTLRCGLLWYFAAATRWLPPIPTWLVAFSVGGGAVSVASSAIPVSPLAIAVRLVVAAFALMMFCAQLVSFMDSSRFPSLTKLIRHLHWFPITRVPDLESNPEG